MQEGQPTLTHNLCLGDAGLLRSDDAELVQHVQRLQQDHVDMVADWAAAHR